MSKFTNGISFEWLKNSAQIKFDKGITNPLFQKDVGEIFKKYSYEYTPYSINNAYGDAKYHMVDLSYVTANSQGAKIVYTKPYAKYQYTHSEYVHTKETATDHWVEYAWQVERQNILRDIKLARLKYVK